MTSRTFWNKIDRMLNLISDESDIYVMGTKRLGRACCSNCSGTELSLMAEEDGISADDASFLYYHQQDRDYATGNEVWLGWSGAWVPLIVAGLAYEAGLKCDDPTDESLKIRVYAD